MLVQCGVIGDLVAVVIGVAHDDAVAAVHLFDVTVAAADADTAKVLSCYADIMAMRHPREGAPYVASCNATVPVIKST